MASPAYSNWQEMPHVSLTCHLTETPLSSHVLDSWAYCLSGPIGEPHPWVVSASWLGICCYLKVLWQNIQSCSSLGVTQGGNCSGNIGDFLEGQSLLLPLDWCPGSVRGAVLVGWLGGLLQSAAITLVFGLGWGSSGGACHYWSVAFLLFSHGPSSPGHKSSRCLYYMK